MVFSALLAPIRMLFHTQFVTMALAGRAVRWKSPPRDDRRPAGENAMARHGTHTLVGVLWAAIVGGSIRRTCGGCCRSSAH